MELTSGLICRKLDFYWPGKSPAAPPVLAGVEAFFPSGTLSLVTGETGAGKSTLLHLMAGLLRPTAGEILADGQPVSRWRRDHLDRWRRNVGIVFQHLGLIPELSVGENLLLPLVPRGIGWPDMELAIRLELEAAGLTDLAHAPAGTLSGGQRQALAIARALVTRPRYILADEPTAFQDACATHRIVSRLADAARQGAAVVLCSHDPRLCESTWIDRRFHLEAAALTQIAPAGNIP